MKAEFVRALNDWTGQARLYKVAPPVEYEGDDDATHTADHVVVSTVSRRRFGVNTQGTFADERWVIETLVFPATATGRIVNWTQLDISLKVFAEAKSGT